MLTLFKKKKCLITIGLQISEDKLSLLVLDNNNSPVIKDYITHTVNSSHPLDKVQQTLKEYVDQNHLAAANCCLVLEDDEYQLLTIDAPPVPEDEMAEAVKWKIKDLLQFPVNEAVIDVFLQENSQVEGKYIANVVVAHKALINKKKQQVESFGLQLGAIDIPELVYRNYIESSEHSEKNIALVLIKKNSGKLVVVKNGCVYFSRSFPVHYNGGLFDDLPETEIVLELQRSLDYYERQLKHAIPTDIIFIGENIVEDKITSIIKDSLNQNVLVESIAGYDFSDEDSLSTSNVIASYGAALREGLVAQGGL
jgi:MSHA biogenesis protein MshI